MKRSSINQAFLQASECFRRHYWALPPNPKWDITDFGLGDFASYGLTLINLATEAEYCEKLMYSRKLQLTPCHTHLRKKEDIICRVGKLTLWLWSTRAEAAGEGVASPVGVRIDGQLRECPGGVPLILEAGSRVTLLPGIWHAFAAESAECIIGEVSTANDDKNDNVFLDTNVGRFPGIQEDEPSLVRLLSE